MNQNARWNSEIYVAPVFQFALCCIWCVWLIIKLIICVIRNIPGWQINKKKHCLPFDTVSYPRRMESLPVIMSLKTVIFILTAIATLNLPFASSDLMAFSESVSMCKWREGVLCGSCWIVTVNDNLLVNGIFTVCTLFLQFECKWTPQDICLHFISKQ